MPLKTKNLDPGRRNWGYAVFGAIIVEGDEILEAMAAVATN